MKLTPQEKKIRSYSNQRKNNYGENDKSSRKALYLRKRWVNRSHRRNVNNVLSQHTSDLYEKHDLIQQAKRPNWKKAPNDLIIDVLDRKWSGSSRSKAKRHTSSLRTEAEKRLRKAGVYRNL